jgi:hypothetical protein
VENPGEIRESGLFLDFVSEGGEALPWQQTHNWAGRPDAEMKHGRGALI